MTDAPIDPVAEGTPVPPIPADPPGAPAPAWDEVIAKLGPDLSQVVSVPTTPTSVTPSVFIDENGVPHAIVPLTKKTKGYVGTALALVSFLGLDSAAFLPDQFKPWALGAATVAGVIATFLGIVLPTNLPVSKK